MRKTRPRPFISIEEGKGGEIRAFRIGASEAALLNHMVEVCDAIERGTATYAHEDVVLHYLRMFDKDWSRR